MRNHDSIDFEDFIRTLPDPAGARTFLERLCTLDPRPLIGFERDRNLLARLLTLAAYSPYLGETLLRHPEHIAWLQREASRGFDRTKPLDQLREKLARFVTGAIERDLRAKLARFKRRELCRIYLRDCVERATLAEVTDELSNLADVILDHALAVSLQRRINLNGTPLVRDERGRIEQARFAVVSLGKLGCRELNYASDIDLLFLYSGDGATAGDGRRPDSAINNKEFFAGVAEQIVQLVGGNSGEGSVYRIDLRLRPYGRDGDTVWEIERAARYYQEKAENWERQALIRARASAGDERVVSEFLGLVRDVVFARDILPSTIADVRRAKEKIDRSVARRGGGFNVKLGRGGIREIEFIAQALQLARGGREPWVRSAQTLIVLRRLAEKGFLTDGECGSLSGAYEFLRKVEHRLQMEHGAQTHRLPLTHHRAELLARRCGYAERADPVAQFMSDLETHTSAVRAVYERVFAAEDRTAGSPADKQQYAAAIAEAEDEAGRLIQRAVLAVHKIVGMSDPVEPIQTSAIEDAIRSAATKAINVGRSLRNLTAWAESFATYQRAPAPIASDLMREWPALIERLIITLSSPFLAHVLISRPAIASVSIQPQLPADSPLNFRDMLQAAIRVESGLPARRDALRRAWHRQLIRMGHRDMSAAGDRASVSADERRLIEKQTDAALRASNVEQTALAEAVLSLAVEMVIESMGLGRLADSSTAGHRQPTAGQNALRFAILGLGRLGHAGMDYGSDLDLLVVFDDEGPWPPPALPAQMAERIPSPQEFYAKLTSELVRLLSSITREGFLYRIDLRLRPEGKSGPLAQGLTALVGYLSGRASAWEHSAFLKAREVAGDVQFGARARHAICEACFDAGSRNASLREELASIRDRLEKEKAGRALNVKWGPGGMTDVYFITRYIQLRDRIGYPTERGTTALIRHLGEIGVLDRESASALFEGYWFLRKLDHWMRLLLDRPRTTLPESAVARSDIALAMGLGSTEELEATFYHHTNAIRRVYDGVLRVC